MMKYINRIKTTKKIPLAFSIIIGLFIGCIILLMMQVDPFKLLSKMLHRSFSNTRLFMQFLQEFALYLLLGLSTYFSLRVGFFNLGAPGQMVFAGMCASLFALKTDMPSAAHVLCTTLVAVASAIVYTLIAGAMKLYLGINDIVATVLLNWIALEVLKAIYFNTSAFQTSPTRQDPATPVVPDSSTWIMNGIVNNATFTATIIISICFLMLAFVLMKFTKLGYKINFVGKNERAAYIAGYNTKKITIISILISGLLVGLFTMGYYFGKNTQMNEINTSFPPALGFNGLILYTIAGQTISGLVFASLLMDFLQGPSSENIIGIPSSMPQIFSASIIYCVAITKAFENWFNIKEYFINLWTKAKNIWEIHITKKVKNEHI